MYGDISRDVIIVINMPTKTYLAVETMPFFVPGLANLNIKRNVT